jgi:hypothetical protein
MRYLAPLILAAGLATAGPPPKSPAEPVMWLPSAVGDKLVFEETRPAAEGTATRLITRTVLSVDRKGGSVWVSIKEEKPPLDPRIVRPDSGEGLLTESHVYQQTGAGVFLMIQGDLEVLDPPCCVARLPLTAGDAWEVKNQAVFPAAIRYTTGKEEEVEVPAGKFKAVRIDKESVLRDGKTIRVTDWVVLGLGTVKGRARLWDGTEVVQVLKSFAPGRK